MPNSGKHDKPFASRLKEFFRVGKGEGFMRHSQDRLVIKQEMVQELGKENNLSVRIKTLKELQPQVKEKRLEDHGVELLWYKLRDLIEPDLHDGETRKQVYDFLCDLVVGQYGCALDLIRPQVLMVLSDHQVSDDFEGKVALVGALTDEGKDILHIEERLGPYLLHLLAHLVRGQAQGKPGANDGCESLMRVLELWCNMLQYNSAYLDQEVIVILIQSLASIACTSGEDKEILKCLHNIKCIVMYSFVPPPAP